MNSMTIERKKTDCNALPKGWQREEVLRKSGLSAGKVDVYYYSPSGGKIETKSKLVRQLGDTIDLSTFDYQTGRHQMLNPNAVHHQSTATSNLLAAHYQRPTLRRTFTDSSSASGSSPTPSTTASTPLSPTLSSSMASLQTAQLPPPPPPPQPIKQSNLFEFSRGVRTDVSLVPPIRQTASIFKQPVTIHRNQESKVQSDLKYGTLQEKPKQLFWEKRLEGLHACDIDGTEFGPIDLPRGLKPVGPHINNGTLLQSVATALHVTTQAITGQTAPKSALTSNSGVYLNPEQPLMHSISISEDDIRRQEDRVTNARKKLQDALKC